MSGIPPRSFLPPNQPAHHIQPHQEEKEPEEEKFNNPQFVQRVADNVMQDISAAAAAPSSVVKKRKIDQAADDDTHPQNKASRLANQMRKTRPSSGAVAAAIEPQLTLREKRELKLLNTKPTVFFRQIADIFLLGKFNGKARMQINNFQEFMRLHSKNEVIITESLNFLNKLLVEYLVQQDTTCRLMDLPLINEFLTILSSIEILAQPAHFRNSWLILERLSEIAFVDERYGDVHDRFITEKQNALVAENLRQWQAGAPPEPMGGYERASLAIQKCLMKNSGRSNLDISNHGLSTLPECLWVGHYNELNLSFNLLEGLPNLQQVNIVSLNLNSNRLTSLPANIVDCERLTYLKVEDNPQLEALPENLKECRYIIEIECKGSALSQSSVRQMIVACVSHPKHQEELRVQLSHLNPSVNSNFEEPIYHLDPFIQGKLSVFLGKLREGNKLHTLLHFLKNLMSSSSSRQLFSLLMEDINWKDSLDIETLTSWEIFLDKQFLIEILEIIPQNFRTEFFRKMTIKLREGRFLVPHMLPSEKLVVLFSELSEMDYIREEISEKLQEMLEPDPNGLLTKEDRNHHFVYAQRMLQLLDLCHNPYPQLRVYAVRLFFKFDPALEKKNNPYHVFNELKLLVKEEPQYVNASFSSLNLMGAEGESRAQEAAINLDNLRERANTGFYKVSDLPPLPAEIGLNYFTQLFISVKARLVGATSQTRAEFKDLLLTLFQIRGASIQEKAREANQDELIYLINYCESLCLSQGKRLPELLIISKNKEAPIVDVQFHLFCSMKALEEESNEKKEGEFLTPREIQAFKFLNILRHCKVGQDEEITSYYNLLPPKFRQTIVPVGALARISKLCDDLIQKQIDDVINDQTFLDEASLVPDVRQQVHQKRFIKNRFAHHIGLRHRLEFDEGSQTIADNFIASLEKIDSSKPENPAQLILNKFYQKFTPQALFNALKGRIVESANKAKEIDDELNAKLKEKILDASEVQKEKAIRYQAEHLVTQQDWMTLLTESGIAQRSDDGGVTWPDYLLYNDDYYLEFNGLNDTTLLAVFKQQNILITERAEVLPPNHQMLDIQPHQEEKEPEEEKFNNHQIVQSTAANAVQDIPVAAAAAPPSNLKKRKIDQAADEDTPPQNKASRLTNQMGETAPSSSRAAAAEESQLTAKEKRKAFFNTKPDVFFQQIENIYLKGNLRSRGQLKKFQKFIKLHSKNQEIINESLNFLKTMLDKYLNQNTESCLIDLSLINGFLTIMSSTELLAQSAHFRNSWLILKRMNEIAFRDARYRGVNKALIEEEKHSLVAENLRQWRVGVGLEQIDRYERASLVIQEAIFKGSGSDINISNYDLPSLPECLSVIDDDEP